MQMFIRTKKYISMSLNLLLLFVYLMSILVQQLILSDVAC